MSAGMGPEATERAQSEQEQRDDIAAGEVWPEETEDFDGLGSIVSDADPGL